MSKRVIQLNDVANSTTWGGRATINCPIGPRYHAIWIEAHGYRATATVLETAAFDATRDVVVKLNGVPVRTCNPTLLDSINKIWGAQYGRQHIGGASDAACEAGVTTLAAANTTDDYNIIKQPIYFFEPWREEYAAKDMMALPTQWADGSKLQSFQIDVPIGADAGSATIKIKAYAEIDDRLGPLDKSGKPVLLMSYWKNLQFSSAAGAITLANLDRKDKLQALYFKNSSSAAFSKVRVTRDGNVERDDVTKAQNDAFLVSQGAYVSNLDTGRMDVVFDYDDLPNGALDLSKSNSFEVQITASAAETCTLISQYYGNPLA